MPDYIDLTNVAHEICKSRDLNLIEKVGEGTFKETFKVSDRDSYCYALKIYKSEDIDTRTQREIDSMMRCNHPGIAKIIDLSIYHIDDFRFLFLLEEYFGGGTLEDMIERNVEADKKKIIYLGNELLNSISYIASLKLVHRDIKPANILFRENSDKPIITDFGIVRDLQATTETKTWLPSGPGTPLFAAPEQLNNEKDLIDWRTDQFSLGVTLSFYAFRIHPYDHLGYVGAHIIEEVAKRGNISLQFKKEIEETELPILEKMVSVWPANRYRTPELLSERWIKQGE